MKKIQQGTTHRSRSRRRGAAVVEFALLAPLIALLLVGMFEISRGIMGPEILSDAVRRGCRAGILPGADNSAVINAVKDVLTLNNIDPASATITIQVNSQAADVSTAEQNDKISVQVSVPASQVLWTSPYFFSNSSIESETVVMQRQG